MAGGRRQEAEGSVLTMLNNQARGKNLAIPEIYACHYVLIYLATAIKIQTRSRFKKIIARYHRVNSLMQEDTCSSHGGQQADDAGIFLLKRNTGKN